MSGDTPFQESSSRSIPGPREVRRRYASTIARSISIERVSRKSCRTSQGGIRPRQAGHGRHQPSTARMTKAERSAYRGSCVPGLRNGTTGVRFRRTAARRAAPRPAGGSPASMPRWIRVHPGSQGRAPLKKARKNRGGRETNVPASSAPELPSRARHQPWEAGRSATRRSEAVNSSSWKWGRRWATAV